MWQDVGEWGRAACRTSCRVTLATSMGWRGSLKKLSGSHLALLSCQGGLRGGDRVSEPVLAVRAVPRRAGYGVPLPAVRALRGRRVPRAA